MRWDRPGGAPSAHPPPPGHRPVAVPRTASLLPCPSSSSIGLPADAGLGAVRVPLAVLVAQRAHIARGARCRGGSGARAARFGRRGACRVAGARPGGCLVARWRWRVVWRTGRLRCGRGRRARRRSPAHPVQRLPHGRLYDLGFRPPVGAGRRGQGGGGGGQGRRLGLPHAHASGHRGGRGRHREQERCRGRRSMHPRHSAVCGAPSRARRPMMPRTGDVQVRRQTGRTARAAAVCCRDTASLTGHGRLEATGRRRT